LIQKWATQSCAISFYKSILETIQVHIIQPTKSQNFKNQAYKYTKEKCFGFGFGFVEFSQPTMHRVTLSFHQIIV
jgi:hypothetical protein